MTEAPANYISQHWSSSVAPGPVVVKVVVSGIKELVENRK
jgi:hypothetical protein